MHKEIVKDRWGLLAAFGLMLITGTYGVFVLGLALLVALVHAVKPKTV